MTQYLPPNLLALFAPREPIQYLPPPDKLPTEKKNVHIYHGIANLVQNFEDPEDTPPPTKVETRVERYVLAWHRGVWGLVKVFCKYTVTPL